MSEDTKKNNRPKKYCTLSKEDITHVDSELSQ